jgi:hypothetical protein
MFRVFCEVETIIFCITYVSFNLTIAHKSQREKTEPVWYLPYSGTEWCRVKWKRRILLKHTYTASHSHKGFIILEICALLGYYATSCGNCLPTCCPETSVNNYYTALRNIPEERRSHKHRGGSLKSRFVIHLVFTSWRWSDQDDRDWQGMVYARSVDQVIAKDLQLPAGQGYSPGKPLVPSFWIVQPSIPQLFARLNNPCISIFITLTRVKPKCLFLP